MRIIFLSLLFTFILVLSDNLEADPLIMGITGTCSNGQTVIINGTGFGSKASAGPAISSYDNITAADNFHEGYIGGNWYALNNTHLDTSQSYRRAGTYQSDHYADCEYIDGENYNRIIYTGSLGLGNYFYASFWHYITSSSFTVSTGSGNSKIWMWYIAGSTNKIMETYYKSGGGEVDAYIASSDGYTGSLYGQWTNGLANLPYQTWHHIEIWAYSGTSGNTDAWLRTAIDGQSCRYMHGYGFPTRTTNQWHFGQGSGCNYSGGSILLDQIYIDSTAAHVFISDDPSITDWIQNTTKAHNETQVASSWTDTAIQFTLNQGSFGNTDTVYLYVVDANGVINSPGYPVTLGHIFSDDTTSPSIPDALKVQ